MKYCMKCGGSMDDDAAFCPTCGQPTAAETIGPAPRASVAIFADRRLAFSRRTWVLVALCLLVLVGVFTLAQMSRFKDKYPVETTSEQIPFETQRRANKDMLEGEETVVQEGRDGTLERYTYFHEKYVDGELRLREQIPAGNKKESVIVAKPVKEIVEYGTKLPTQVTMEPPQNQEGDPASHGYFQPVNTYDLGRKREVSRIEITWTTGNPGGAGGTGPVEFLKSTDESDWTRFGTATGVAHQQATKVFTNIGAARYIRISCPTKYVDDSMIHVQFK